MLHYISFVIELLRDVHAICFWDVNNATKIKLRGEVYILKLHRNLMVTSQCWNIILESLICFA